MKHDRKVLTAKTVRRDFKIFVIVGFAVLLIFSVFLPSLSSGSEDVVVEEGTKEKEMDQKLIQESDSEGENEELKGYIPSDIKDVKPKNIWHTGVPNGQHKKGPFDTDEATVYLNLTGRGNPNEIVDPFDWVFSIDSSGSMDYNDENDMRIDAAQHFVDRVKNSNATGSRGASIDFDSGSTLINGHHLSDNYPRIKQDLENIDSSGGTDFSPPLQTALNEFQNYGNTSRHDASSDGKPGWFHIFLTDGEGDIDWSKVDAHSQLNIPIYTIGFGDVDDQTLIEMAQRTGGDYHYCTDASELDEVFDAIFEQISALDKTAVEQVPDESMVKEVLPPYLEYVENSCNRTGDNFTRNDNILQWNIEKLNINETWKVKYRVRAKKPSHDLPVTDYDKKGNARSKVTYENSSGTIEIPTTATLNVHGLPGPVLGPEGARADVGTPVVFKNRTDDNKSSWPGDCNIVKYKWDFGDGSTYTEKASEEDFDGKAEGHPFTGPGRYEVTLNATAECGAWNTITEPITIMAPAPPAPPPPPPPSSPPPPGMGIANPTATPVQVGVGNPMAQPTPTGVPQPTATPQMTMQPVATSQPVGMPTTTAVFAGFMPVAAQKNPAEKIKMSVKNLN